MEIVTIPEAIMEAVTVPEAFMEAVDVPEVTMDAKSIVTEPAPEATPIAGPAPETAHVTGPAPETMHVTRPESTIPELKHGLLPGFGWGRFCGPQAWINAFWTTLGNGLGMDPKVWVLCLNTCWSTQVLEHRCQDFFRCCLWRVPQSGTVTRGVLSGSMLTACWRGTLCQALRRPPKVIGQVNS